MVNTSAALVRRPSTPFVSSPLKEQSGSIGKRSKSQRKPIMTIPIKQERKNTWSTFFQQKQPLASPSSVRKIGGWLSRKALKEMGTDWNVLLHTMFQYDIWKDNLANTNQYVISFQECHGANLQLDNLVLQT